MSLTIFRTTWKRYARKRERESDSESYLLMSIPVETSIRTDEQHENIESKQNKMRQSRRSFNFKIRPKPKHITHTHRAFDSFSTSFSSSFLFSLGLSVIRCDNARVVWMKWANRIERSGYSCIKLKMFVNATLAPLTKQYIYIYMYISYNRRLCIRPSV